MAQVVEEGSGSSSRPARCRPSARRAGRPWSRSASAMAISSWRRSPWDSSAAGTSARVRRGRRRSRAAMAGSVRLGVGHDRAEEAEARPCRAWTASMTLRSADNSGASEEIWKVRARPSRARAASRARLMSCPRKRIVPLSGMSAPRDLVDQCRLAGAVRADQRVDLAGPEIEADAVGRLQRAEGLPRPRISRIGSAMARLSGDQADEAAAGEQHDAEQDEAEEELPVFGEPPSWFSSST